MKAFLSHYSGDKDIVAKVANYLGRERVNYDVFCFENGKEFSDSINQYLLDTDVFVLFISRKTLERPYVIEELALAEELFKKKEIQYVFIYLLDKSIKIKKLPKWLQSKKNFSTNQYKIISREIQNKIYQLMGSPHEFGLIGRDKDKEEIEDSLLTSWLSPPEKILFINGLTGVGRKSLARDIAISKFSYSRAIFIEIEECDHLPQTIMKLHNLAGNASGDIVKQYKTLKLKTEEELLNELGTLLKSFESAKECLIFQDAGGLLQQDGTPADILLKIIGIIKDTEGMLSFITSTRKAKGLGKLEVPQHNLYPLTEKNMTKLLVHIAALRKIDLKKLNLIELSRGLGGYPPSAYYAISLAKKYGPEMLFNINNKVASFQTVNFVKFLEGQVLSEEAKKILRLLAFYSPLPIRIIEPLIGISLGELQNLLMELIDMSIVNIDSTGLYSIAPPLVNAAFNLYEMPEQNIHIEIDKLLKEYLDEDIRKEILLSISRLSGKASRYANTKKSPRALSFNSDLLDVASRLYKEPDYKKVIEIVKEVIRDEGNNYRAWSLLIRSLIQTEKMDSAEKHIGKIEHFSAPRDILFLKGFLHRKSGNINEAIKCYEQATDLGHKGVAIYRELAQCYLEINKPDIALDNINKALERTDDDDYLIDLLAKISIIKRDNQTAENALARLKPIAKVGFFEHRMCSYELSKGNIKNAIRLAQDAIRICKRATFEMYVQLVQCYIEDGEKLKALNIINIIDSKFPTTKHDIRKLLRCKVLCLDYKHDTALELYEEIKNKTTRYAMRVHLEILSGLITNGNISKSDKDAYSEQIKQIERRLEVNPSVIYELLIEQ